MELLESSFDPMEFSDMHVLDIILYLAIRNFVYDMLS